MRDARGICDEENKRGGGDGRDLARTMNCRRRRQGVDSEGPGEPVEKHWRRFGETVEKRDIDEDGSRITSNRGQGKDENSKLTTRQKRETKLCLGKRRTAATIG
jgi:hypothetical protein